jgi:surface carbohydrate biosynthesis protein
MTAALDEEVFGITPSRGYLAATTHPHAAALSDLVCAQGPAYARAFPYPSKLAVTGTPRTLTYKQVKGGGGDDILVCLQFGNINNNGRTFDKMVADTLGLCASLATENGAAWAKILRDAIAQECDALPLMRQTIDALAAAFPHRRVVVRPHPVEDPSLWSFAQSNVVIDRNHSVLESMATSAVAVYVSGCTTGLDAYLSGLPAVRLGTGGHGVSAHMNAAVTTPAEAVEAVRRAEKWPGGLDDFFAPLNLVPALQELWRNNRATGTAAINGKVNAVPKDVHLRKFPNTAAAEVEALVGKPVRELGWNTFLI